MADLWGPVNGIYTAATPLLPWLDSLPRIDAIELGGALISAGFGAGFGAWMAGRIARNTKLRDELLVELRSADVALTLCASIMDVAGAFKKQHVLIVQNKHKSDLEQFKKHQKANVQGEPFILKMDHLKFQLIKPPVAELRIMVLKEVSVSPNGVKSMVALADAVENLNGMIVRYNDILEMFESGTLPIGFKAEHYYLALPVKGVTHNEYVSALEGIATYTDDVLFFARKLAECITLQGSKVAGRFAAVSGEARPVRKIAALEENEGLFPLEGNYENWMKGWEEEPDNKVKKSWWRLFK
ncbi:hypothetical protein L1F06_015420 [Ectopseudomonas hydrolytica]|uniref:PNPLA domain-containing protein n=1 Tax=Ectopseudomonas hydrolytica TaxID=2493633 RepID=A0ABY5A4S7_9GAMM|nr:hypothetical protein [Pseudomonas hydrolytica]USR38059.1 hypothetical protein L1F06_015420 [Pseudomonas hydrolytica]